MSNIAIIGNGAIGQLLASFLREKHEVVAASRSQQINISNCSLVIFCTKAYDLESTFNQYKTQLRENQIVLLLQNGIGIKELAFGNIKNDVIEANILRSLCYIGASLDEGVVVHNGGNTLLFESSKHNAFLKSIFEETPITSRFSENITKDEYKKAIVNAAINPLTVYFNCKNGELLKKAKESVHGIIDECIQVCRAEGIEIDESIHSRVEEIISKTAENTSSMLQDIQNNRKTEINYINNVFLTLAEKHKLKMPLNASMVTYIENLEELQ